MATGVFAVQRNKLIVPNAMDKTGVPGRNGQLPARVMSPNVPGRPEGVRFRSLTFYPGEASPLV
jgi:hypothetical protein